MRILKRFMSLALATVLLSSVCLSALSCKKKDPDVKKVSATDPWYTAKRVVLDPKINVEGSSSYSNGPWMVGDKYLMVYHIFTNYQDTLLGIFDLDGNLLRKIDLEEIMNHDGRHPGCNPMAFAEGETGAVIYYSPSISKELYTREIDLETGLPLGSPAEVDLTLITQKEKGYEDFFLERLQLIEGYEVFQLMNMYTKENRFVIGKDGKALYVVNHASAFGPDELKIVQNFYGGGNGTVVFQGFGKTHVAGKFDLATGTVTRLVDAKPISEKQKISSTMDGRGYLTKATGIYEYGSEDGKEICVLNFDNCDINRCESQAASVLYIDENKAVLGSYIPPANKQVNDSPVVVYRLEKTEKNPNEGKKIITVASLSDSISYTEGEALRLFNQRDPEYFAQLILYDQNEFLSTGNLTEDQDESDRQMYNAMSMVSGNLASDIRSGAGPDVILGAAHSIDILDSKYLMDLNAYLEGSSYHADAYYSNLIDAAKMDGKTYFIPTSFTVAGIVTDGTKLEKDKTGFTYDEYISFVNGPLNGVEPVTQSISRMHFMSLCVQSNYADWTKEGRLDFNQDGFRTLAGFFKERIPEGVSVARPDADDSWSDEFGFPPTETAATYIENIDGISAIAHYNFYREDVRIVGLPSADGTGLSASVATSFSVTAGTKVKEGAFALLDTMLSFDAQKETREAISVNREAEKYCVEKEKEDSLQTYAFYADADGLLYPILDCLRMTSCIEPGSKLPDMFLLSLEEVDSIFFPDNAIMMIMSEEIPAYLLGQKDIDTVIATINNRSKTVFNER